MAVLNLVYEMEHLKEKRKKYALILLDFSKAFDLIDHSLLFGKLDRFGFSHESIKLIKSYLGRREMYVEVNDAKSATVKLGDVSTPQGSVLGPLLYLIYTIELKELLKDHFHIMFADDTAILMALETDNPGEQIESVLEKVWLHCSSSRLKLNASKTEIMTNLPSMELEINGTIIRTKEKKESATYLGVEINADLDWKDHVEKVRRKARNGLFALRKLGKIQGKKAKKMVYESLVKSHLTYGITAWGHSCQKGELKKLQVIQKACVRTIAGAHRLGHTEPLFKQLGILKLEDLIKNTALGLVKSLQSRTNKNNNLNKYIKREIDREIY